MRLRSKWWLLDLPPKTFVLDGAEASRWPRQRGGSRGSRRGGRGRRICGRSCGEHTGSYSGNGGSGREILQMCILLAFRWQQRQWSDGLLKNPEAITRKGRQHCRCCAGSCYWHSGVLIGILLRSNLQLAQKVSNTSARTP